MRALGGVPAGTSLCLRPRVPTSEAEGRARDFEAYSELLGRWFSVHAYPSSSGLAVYLQDITARHTAERALRDSERRYRALFDHSMDAVLLTAPDGRIAMANPACCELLGYREEELRQLGEEAVLDSSNPRLANMLAQRSATRRCRGEVNLRRKDGSRFPAEISSALFIDESGAAWTSMFIRDISERQARAREHQELETQRDAERQFLHAVLAHVPVGAIYFDAQGSLHYNQRAEELFGMRFDPRLGSAQYAHRLLYPDGTPVPREQMVSARVLRTGETITEAAFLIQRTDGSRIPILGSAAPIRDAQGHIRGAVGMFQDVSRSKRAEEELRAREGLLSAIFDILPVGLSIADRSGLYTRNNDAVMQLWDGQPPKDVFDFDHTRVRPDDGTQVEFAEGWPPTRAFLGGEATLARVIRVAHACDERTLLLSALPLRDHQQQIHGVIVAYEDVSGLKRVEAELRRTVQSREAILSIVAHDLRSPLHGVVLATDLIEMQVRLGRQVQVQTVQEVLRALQRMDRMVEDLLDITCIEAQSLSVRREPMRPAELLAELNASHRAAAEQTRRELSVVCSADLELLSADSHRLLQVLDNLVTNALKFTRPGGHVSVHAMPDGSHVRFEVRDDGPGIDPGHLPHLFDRFWQVNRADKRGAGLGLAIAKGIVEAHGGHLWVESEPGVGATFCFSIPRT